MNEEADIKDILEAQKKILDVLEKLEAEDPDSPPSYGEKIADKVVTFVGSWRFIIAQGVLFAIYILGNGILLASKSFDPYPFILLNLLLSFQAAFTAPLILISQNRTDKKDRRRAIDAYKTIIHIEEMMGKLHKKIERSKNGHREQKK